MLTETLTRRLRLDSGDVRDEAESPRRAPYAATVATLAIFFVLLGGGGLEPTDAEAHLGLAAGETLSPFGQVLGGYDPSLPPGQVWVARLWAWVEGGVPSAGAVRWPSALAAVGIGLILSRRMARVLGPRAGVLAALTAFGSLALIDRSAALGVDALTGLALVATLDRLISGRADWLCGLFAACTLMLGGWPALATVVLPMIVLGRGAPAPGRALLVPPLIAFVAWSAWALNFARAEVWAAVLTFPLTQGPSWWLVRGALTAGLPWSPLALAVAWPAIRAGWDAPTRGLVASWLKVAGVGLLAGTIVPGFASCGMLAIVAGLAVVSAAVIDRVWDGAISGRAKWTVILLAFSIAGVVAARAILFGTYLAAAQPYYRGVGLVLIGVGLAAALLAVDSLWARSARGAIRGLIAAALVAKVAYAAYYVPETNYRFGKGPWGRAVGQYVPPRWPIYTLHSISPALAFATEHPVRQLRAEIFLKVQPGDGPKFVLMTDSEFAHWAKDAPKVRKVRDFQDEYGGIRVLARTEGALIPREGD